MGYYDSTDITEISECYKSPASTVELVVEQFASSSSAVSENTKENMMMKVSWTAQKGSATLEMTHISHSPKPTSHRQATESVC